MDRSRDQICKASAQMLVDALQGLSGLRAVVGFDGFVDEIIAVVDKRYGDDRTTRSGRSPRWATRSGTRPGQSSNYELVVKQRKLGGNGPIMANALASLGLDVTYIGNLGYPTIHPVFQRVRHPGQASSASPSPATPTPWSSTTASSCSASTSR